MGTFADGICGDDVARGDVACAGRVRRACEGGRGGGIYGAYVRVARWRVRGADAGVDGRWAWMGCATLARGMAIARDGDRAMAW